jgi:hypothetical protein
MSFGWLKLYEIRATSSNRVEENSPSVVLADLSYLRFGGMFRGRNTCRAVLGAAKPLMSL